MKKTFAVALLAGGKSSRMGVNKAQLKIGKKTFLEIQTEKLESLSPSQYMLLSDCLRLSGWENVTDIYEGKGPMGGIYTGLEKSREESCLFLSVDSVGVTGEVLEALIKCHTEEGNDVTILAHSDGVLEPLIGIYEKRLSNIIKENILSEKLKIVRLLNDLKEEKMIKMGTFHIPEDIICNCNTPEDYEKLINRYKFV